MSRLFTLPEAARRDPAIDAWLDSKPDELGAIARRWFTFLRGLGDDVRECMHDGHPTACVGESAFAYVNAYTRHVNVGFFHGATLPDPHSILQGKGRFMRHVKLQPGAEVDDEALSALILAAYEDIRRRLRAG